MITKKDVFNALQEWAHAIVNVGQEFLNGQDFIAAADNCLSPLYDWTGGILFKPTKAVNYPIRTSKDEMFSYFIKGYFPEDIGFALEPWSHIDFHEHHVVFPSADVAIVMGDYCFVSNAGKMVYAQYTFGYKLIDGKLKIFLHHSSAPYLAETDMHL